MYIVRRMHGLDIQYTIFIQIRQSYVTAPHFLHRIHSERVCIVCVCQCFAFIPIFFKGLSVFAVEPFVHEQNQNISLHNNSTFQMHNVYFQYFELESKQISLSCIYFHKKICFNL